MAKELVFMSHDGGVDDFLSVMLLMAMDHIQVLGISVTPADCYLEPAVSATRKIMDLMGRSDVSVAAANVRGVNPFPRIFRRDSFSVDHFPILNERKTILTPLSPETSQTFLARILRSAEEPITFLETGPLTVLAETLATDPTLASKIKRIVWMGGALHVPGNIDKIIEGGQDGSAEWNVYWDPFAAAKIWQTNIPITICPLDLTNRVPITSEFVLRLARQRQHPLSDLAGLCYSLVTHQDYFAWDVLTTAYVGQPDMFTLKDWNTEIITTGISQGRTSVRPGGRKVSALHTVDLDRFYSYIFKQWSR